MKLLLLISAFSFAELINLEDDSLLVSLNKTFEDYPPNGCRELKKINSCYEYNYCIWKKNKCFDTDTKAVNILFIGNSFTIRNKMTQNVAGLAKSFGINLRTYMLAGGSMTLQSHAKNDVTKKALDFRPWKKVVLQEQSMFLSQPEYLWRTRTLPYAIILNKMIKEKESETVLFETWGYQYGNPDFYNGHNDDYESMQDRLKEGYEKVNQELENSFVVYVGEAFRAFQKKYSNNLYTYDGRHPSKVGSFLAACVFVKKFFGVDLKKTKYRPKGLKKSISRKVRKLVSESVW